MDMEMKLRVANTIANYLIAFGTLTLVLMAHRVVKLLLSILDALKGGRRG
jgi:hypothetical protein